MKAHYSRYFDHKVFKNFLKSLKRSGKTIEVYQYYDNSIGYPPREETKNLKIETIKMEFFEDNGRYRYTINDELQLDLPVSAYELRGKGCFGYELHSGPREYIVFYFPESLFSTKLKEE